MAKLWQRFSLLVGLTRLQIAAVRPSLPVPFVHVMTGSNWTFDFDDMYVPNAWEPQAVPDGRSLFGNTDTLQYSESEYSTPEGRSVEDWTPEPGAPSDSWQSGSSNGGTSFEASSERTCVSGPFETRLNPKLAMARAGSQANSASPKPSDGLIIDYKYRIYTEQLGHLYGLCDAVPYLLGTRSYLTAIVAFGVRPVPIEAYQDKRGEFVLDPNSMSMLDKAFLMMLWVLHLPIDQRPANWEGLYAGMIVQDDRLVVYNHLGSGT
jgi:hypothetical protein